MKVLGINGGFRQGYQDVSACVIVNGEVLAAVPEERLNRIKFSPGKLPYLSIIEVLEVANVSFEEIDIISFHGSTWGQEIDKKLKTYFVNYFGSCPIIKRYHHHDCHAASAFYQSRFDEALIISSDSSGDGISLQVSHGLGKTINVLKQFERPNSLGIFYSLITQYCGFWKESDEYKLMGLAAEGDADYIDFSWLIDFKNNELKINTDFIIPFIPLQASPHKDEMLFNQDFIDKMGQGRRLPKNELTKFYIDVAASAQRHFERIIIKIVGNYCKKIGVSNLCLAGGTALNIVSSQKILESGIIKDIFVPPSPGDDGISIGAAWLACLEQGFSPVPYETPYLGRSYSNDEIEKVLLSCNVEYEFITNPELLAADALHNNLVIAWFQGRSEFGPRALGNRSILANPCHGEMKDIVNKKIKFRESFRPFGPSLKESKAKNYFKMLKRTSPYMNLTFPVLDKVEPLIPAVIHNGANARIQTVNKDENRKYYILLEEFEKLTGHPVILNTSFNFSKEPMVYSPLDALSTFFSTGLDLLFIGNFLVRKTNNNE